MSIFNQSLSRLFQSHGISRDDFLQAGKALYLSARALSEVRYQQKHILTHAPVSGYVANLEARPGQYAETGQRIMTLIDDSDWWIYSNVKENNLTRVYPGQKVLISLNSCPGFVIRGQVATIARGVDTDEAEPSGLAQVKRTSHWIRLAQRFPVRVTFDRTPLPESCMLYTDRSLTGALLVQEQSKSFGRPIELSGGEDSAWVARSVVVNMLALSQIANKVMILTPPDLRQYSVIFDRSSGSPIEARQILPYAYPGDDYQYSLIVRLLTVS